VSPEALIERIVAESDPAEVAAARADFSQRTGDFAPEDPFHEARLWAAFEDAVLGWGTPPGLLSLRWTERHPDQAMRLAAMRRGWRSVFAVVASGARARVRGLLGGAELDVVPDEGPAGRLAIGDLFVGRLYVDAGVRLGPGALFFERDGHAAIEEVVRVAVGHHRQGEATCDALLRMQMRRWRQPSLRPHHAFRWDAFDERAIRAAPWARRR
jgi:hypothetical protein